MRKIILIKLEWMDAIGFEKKIIGKMCKNAVVERPLIKV